MKKWIFFLACFGLVAFLSGKGTGGEDVATLEPVQTVRIFTDGEEILLQTDSGAKGRGKTLDEAIRTMHETSSSRVFLDTADYLLIAPELIDLLPAMEQLLRPSCRICVVLDEPDMEQVGAYLTLHKPKYTLKDYLAGSRELPTLKITEEGMRLVS